MNHEARTISAIKEISTIFAQRERARNWNKFGYRFFNPKQVNYTVDFARLDAFLEGKRLTKSK